MKEPYSKANLLIRVICQGLADCSHLTQISQSSIVDDTRACTIKYTIHSTIKRYLTVGNAIPQAVTKTHHANRCRFPQICHRLITDFLVSSACYCRNPEKFSSMFFNSIFPTVWSVLYFLAALGCPSINQFGFSQLNSYLGVYIHQCTNSLCGSPKYELPTACYQ